MGDSADQLLTSAQEEFDTLTEAEEKLFRAVVEGKAADFSSDADELNDPAKSDQWNHERTLSAERIIWLCTNTKARELLSYRGIHIIGAKIEGELDLSFATIEMPLKFIKCALSNSISLEEAKLRFLSLEGTHVISIDATWMQVEGSVYLRNGFEAKGEVRLLGVRIGGELDCVGGHFFNEGGNALIAHSANITGPVSLSDGFEAKGVVQLMETSIGGQLDCHGGHFFNEGGNALDADGANITGHVFLCYGFEAKGAVRLPGASIGGYLYCTGGHFFNEGGNALDADGANITSAVFLRDGFEAKGAVRLPGASIGVQLDCSGGHFFNEGGYALVADAAKITGSVLLSDGFEAKGAVRLLGASIGSQLNCSGGHFFNDGGNALSADGANITSAVFLSDGFEAKGAVRLLGASIGSQLNCSGGHFFNEGGDALIADSANITSSVFLSDRFEAKGAVQLSGACIGGDLNCSGGRFFNYGSLVPSILRWLLNSAVKILESSQKVSSRKSRNLKFLAYKILKEQRYALLINGANIEGDVYFTNSFTARGRVSLVSTRIDDTLYLKEINNPDKMTLDLSFARVNTLADEENSWPGEDSLHLNGFTYNTISDSSPPDSKQRLKWLRLQPKEEFALQPYEHLAGVLRNNGDEDAAIKILIGKQHDRLDYGDLKGWKLFWNRFLGKTIAYGYRPERALWYSLAVVFLGTLLFWRGYEAGLISPVSNFAPFDESKPNSQVSENYPVFNPLLYSVDVFLPVVDFHQESHWLPNSKKRSDKILPFPFKTRSDIILHWYFWLHILLGWVFTSLWIAGFTGLIRSQNK
ncbi:MAG: hypothetical protein KME46_13250 [Brasilonema angustatum HA4187-MV1]|jgi:hypothetical protein|nr:hypothetical protein [Brasilonema angustatum HA4187-MV1]